VPELPSKVIEEEPSKISIGQKPASITTDRFSFLLLSWILSLNLNLTLPFTFRFAAVYDGAIEIPESGSYEFEITLKGGTRFYFGGILVADNWDNPSSSVSKASFPSFSTSRLFKIFRFARIRFLLSKQRWSEDKNTRCLVNITLWKKLGLTFV